MNISELQHNTYSASTTFGGISRHAASNTSTGWTPTGQSSRKEAAEIIQEEAMNQSDDKMYEDHGESCTSGRELNLAGKNFTWCGNCLYPQVLTSNKL